MLKREQSLFARIGLAYLQFIVIMGKLFILCIYESDKQI